MNNTNVDSYLRDGCGRCELYQTPACKVHRFPEELVALRELLLASGLVETMKWGAPCYTLDGKNVVMLTALKDYCALGFFKGAALVDPEGELESPGPSSRFARQMRFRSRDEVMQRRAAAAALVEQAIALERAGVKVVPSGPMEAMPAELEQRLAGDAELRRAFEALTPGRQRSHILHVGGAKQSATRAARVDKCAPKILAGRGFNER